MSKVGFVLVMNNNSLCCPICSGKKFGPYNGRENAQCRSCKALERSRYLWMILQRSEVLKPEMRVLHIAPELCFMQVFSARYGRNYHPCDLYPEKYSNPACEVYKMDLCHDLQKMPRSCFDLIIHNHVLEHIPCEVGAVIAMFNQLLVPGGKQFFSVPFRGQTTREDLSPTLSADERTKLFGQSDHLRLFGTVDFPAFLKRKFGKSVTLFRPEGYISVAELQTANIPESVFSGINGHSVFISTGARA